MKNLKTIEEHMEKSFQILKEQFSGIRGGVGSDFLDSLKVHCYDSTFPLREVAQVLPTRPGSAIIKPHDTLILKDILKAVQSANLGVGAWASKQDIQVSMPNMSMEQKEKMAGYVRKLAEDGRWRSGM